MANKKKPLKKQKIRNAEYYDMQTAFDKLYADSVSGRQFRNLVELIQRPENIMLAYRNLRKNSGSKTAGVDKKTISDLNKWSDKKLVNHVQRKLDWYVPNAVRRVEIPKDNGKKRPLGIPTIMDRLIQQCILQVLEPICEAKFFKRSNGFRPTHSAENAIAQAERMIQNIGCYYVIDIDIHGFFDNVNHGKLLKQMWALGIRDKKLLSIISAMLKAEVAGIGFPEKGTPQGGIISPLLSNIVLNELDWWVASQWEEMPTKRNYVHRIYANGTPDKSNTIINVINAGCKSPDQPVWAIEGDIKGCFDNINHRLLLQKLWRIGIHDKRVLKIISQMLKAGYMENDLFHATELGTPQGGILSPLLSNVYLNDFDWYVGRMYMEPHRQCKHKGNDTRRLKWAGVTPKYNYRYADDWVILTSTEKEALRLKRVLTKYFRNRMKLELSQEKTYVTDLRTNGIHFLGFVVKAERKRKTPDPATWTNHLVGKPLPDMERLGKKIKKLLEEVHRIELCQKVNVQAAQIQYVNSVIMGMAQYLQTSICAHAYHAIDRRVNNAALAVWKKLYPKRYNSMQVPLKVLCNLPDRHKGYDSKTFAVWVEGNWFGITYAFITHSHYESKPFDQKMTPYTVEGRRRYVSYRAKHKPLPCDRPSVNSPNDIAISAYAKGRMNFEYYMNREYAYSRDKGKCKCCGNAFSPMLQKNCHHVKNKLPLDRINKVPNLVWLCEPCHRMVHNSPIPPELNAKTVGKIMKYREKLKM